MEDHAGARFSKSGFTQAVRDGDRVVIWHSLFGTPKVASAALLAILDIFAEPRTLQSFGDEYEVDGGVQMVIKELIDDRFLIPEGFDERALLAETMARREQTIVDGSMIDYLELIMSEACNFRCTYCIHFNNLETSTRLGVGKKTMKFEVATEAIDRYLSILRSHKKKIAEINFGGGEPLLAWPVMVQVLEYCQTRYGQEFVFNFSVNTNAALITPAIAAVLKKHSVSVATSLDGLAEGNDRVRLTNNRKGTFDAIVKGYDTLAAAGYPINGIAVTVNEDNFPYLTTDIIDWAAGRGMIEVRIDTDVIDMVEVPVADIVARLMGIRRHAKQHGIEVPGFWSRPAENLNHPTLDDHVAFCGAVRGNSMCISPSGGIYGCGYSTTQLGTLADIGNFHASENAYHRFVRDHLTGTMEMCKGCMIEGQCGGGCNITQEFAKATHTEKIDRMCDFYRLMTQELLLEQLQELGKNAKGGGKNAEAVG